MAKKKPDGLTRRLSTDQEINQDSIRYACQLVYLDMAADLSTKVLDELERNVLPARAQLLTDPANYFPNTPYTSPSPDDRLLEDLYGKWLRSTKIHTSPDLQFLRAVDDWVMRRDRVDVGGLDYTNRLFLYRGFWLRTYAPVDAQEVSARAIQLLPIRMEDGKLTAAGYPILIHRNPALETIDQAKARIMEELEEFVENELRDAWGDSADDYESTGLSSTYAMYLEWLARLNVERQTYEKIGEFERNAKTIYDGVRSASLVSGIPVVPLPAGRPKKKRSVVAKFTSPSKEKT